MQFFSRKADDVRDDVTDGAQSETGPPWFKAKSQEESETGSLTQATSGDEGKDVYKGGGQEGPAKKKRFRRVVTRLKSVFQIGFSKVANKAKGMLKRAKEKQVYAFGWHPSILASTSTPSVPSGRAD